MSGNVRSSHLRCSARRNVLRNFAKLTGKHLCQSLFFNKVAGQLFLRNASELLLLKCLNKKRSKRKWWAKLLKKKSSDVLTYQAKMINFIISFHTQWKVFFQIKLHPGMKFYSLDPGMKLACKQKFFHPGKSFISGWDFVSVTCKRTPCYLSDDIN